MLGQTAIFLKCHDGYFNDFPCLQVWRIPDILCTYLLVFTIDTDVVFKVSSFISLISYSLINVTGNCLS